jgi:hypothetical protein
MDPSEIVFNDTWVLWSHEITDEDYSMKSYKKCFEVQNMKDFIREFTQYKEEQWIQKMYFFMRKRALPRLEDPSNVHGGSWSFRVNKNYCYTSWFSLCLQLVGECLVEDATKMKRMNGVSISPKNNTSTIRVWCATSDSDLKFKYVIPNIEMSKSIYRKNQ